MRTVNSIIEAMPRSGIREVMDLAWSTPGVIHLEVGDPNFDTPEHIRVAAAKAAKDGYTRYTPNAGVPELREALAHKVTTRNDIRCDADQILVTVGAINALYQTFAVVCEVGDAILIPDPGWPNYEMMAAATGLRPVRYRLDPDDGFLPDLDHVASQAEASGASAIVVNSPSNPTGAVFDRRTQEQLLDVAHRYDLWVISDECYEDIVFEGPHLSPGSLDPDRVVSVFSFSKSYAMTGWRVGYSVAPQWITSTMAKLTEAVTSCVNGMAQIAAKEAITGDQSCVQSMRSQYQHRRDVASKALAEARMLVAQPHGAFYIMADVSSAGRNGYDLCTWLVREHGVATAPGETFGPTGAGMIRLSLAASDDDVAEGVARVVKAVAG